MVLFNNKKQIIFDITPIYKNDCFGGALLNKLTNMINQNNIINFHIRCNKNLISIIQLSWINSITVIKNNYCILSHKNNKQEYYNSVFKIHKDIKSIFFSSLSYH